MWTISLKDLIRRTRPRSAAEEATFNLGRYNARQLALDTWTDRAASYNQDRDASQEMVYGAVSLASELAKRTARMSSILSPERADVPLQAVDIARARDTCIDLVNYSQWMYGLLELLDDRKETEDEQQG